MSGMLRVRRSRGALSGALLVLLGAWGAIVAFIGPTFGYAYTPNSTWTYTSGRLWLEVLPGVGALLGGLVLLISASRPATLFGAWLAAVSGGWFVVGAIVVPTWINARITAGAPVGSPTTRALEEIGFFLGLGVVIVFLAATALGRVSVIAVSDRAVARPADTAARATAVPTATTTTGTSRALDGAMLARWRQRLAASRQTDTAAGAGTRQDQPTTANR
jgi:hypothetical protein